MKLALILILALVGCKQEHRPENRPSLPLIAVKPECVGGGISSGDGAIYKCSDQGKYVVDEEATKQMMAIVQKVSKSRDELVWALRTRILTDAEMDKVKTEGSELLLPPCVGTCSIPGDLDERFNALLLQQFNMRLAAEKRPKSVYQGGVCKAGENYGTFGLHCYDGLLYAISDPNAPDLADDYGQGPLHLRPSIKDDTTVSRWPKPGDIIPIGAGPDPGQPVYQNYEGSTGYKDNCTHTETDQICSGLPVPYTAPPAKPMNAPPVPRKSCKMPADVDICPPVMLDKKDAK